MKKKDRPTDGGGNWMDTYGDMVTLLLCFFVLLFSMSSLDSKKWEVFVRSITPDKEIIDDVVINGEISDDADSTGLDELPETEVDMDTLYLTIAEMMEEEGINDVTVSRGDGYTFIVFHDNAFFDGDSSQLTAEGRKVMDVFCEAVGPANSQIQQVNIMAHTAQGDPDKPNNPRTDRMLSAMRSAEVTIYMQAKNVLDPEKMIDVSYGQFRPIASNETREGRAQNRRVELLLIDEGADVRSLNEYYEEYTSGINEDSTVIVGGQTDTGEHGFESSEPGAPENADAEASMMAPLTGEEEQLPADAGAEEFQMPLPTGDVAPDGGFPMPLPSADGAAPVEPAVPADTDVAGDLPMPSSFEVPASE